MPPKTQIPAPIDRPISRAYLREFTGWSTAYPPGMSDPTSLRIMENVMVNRDGSLRIRPGLRYLSFSTPPAGGNPGVALGLQPVGTHEAFYLNDNSKAYLFAVRENDGTVGFRVLVPNVNSAIVKTLTDAGVAFQIPQGAAAINFTSATKYVKYLQIDNKIFALSDAGETMRMFSVGAVKKVRKLSSITVPDFTVADKLKVVHPDASWTTGSTSSSSRTNLLINPRFESLTGWSKLDPADLCTLTNVGTPVHDGSFAGAVNPLPTRTNLMPYPVDALTVSGPTGWDVNTGSTSLASVGSSLRLRVSGGSLGDYKWVTTNLFGGIEAGKTYHAAVDVDAIHSLLTAALMIRYYKSDGTQVGGDDIVRTTNGAGRFASHSVQAPSGATRMRLFVGVRIEKDVTSGTLRDFHFHNVLVCLSTESLTMFSGDSGTNYFWTGAAHVSTSVYQPPVNVSIISTKAAIPALSSMAAAVWARATASGMQALIGTRFYDSLGGVISQDLSAAANVSNGSYARISQISVAPAGATHAALMVSYLNLARGQTQYLDEGLYEVSASVGADFNGSDTSSGTTVYAWTGPPDASTSTVTGYTVSGAIPASETPTANTLISDGSAGHENDYNFGFFYVFSNEVGDSAASQVTVVKASRSWSAWRWETPNSAGEPAGVASETLDPEKTADQLIAIMPQNIFNQAIAQGAISWSLYMMNWSNQDAVPVEGVMIAHRELLPNSIYNSLGWARMTPQSSVYDDTCTVPASTTRHNYTDPSRGGQGIVAADRMIVVKDPTAAAVIRWSSNEQGNYTDFTASRGGGYKTLTSGNLFIPACVKLWQNPQSVDTLTVLCAGTDGLSTGYYMSPASVSSQSDNTLIMGFEETTATPGTTSPYGCEVLNNSLYHPLDEQLMKSTASNYNINHKSQTDQIENRWTSLKFKENIVSSQHDNRIYFIVNNPDGETLEAGNNGNELWVFDASAEAGTWSRWLIQAHSLRKIEYGDKVYMSVVKTDGIYYLDPNYSSDDYVGDALNIAARAIPWRFESNTQGANRAHDAWAHVQQLTLSLGNFQGSMQWGLRSWDVNGKAVDRHKEVRDLNPPDIINNLPFDIVDHLQVRRDLQEWFFYASSVTDENGVVQPSAGQINNVQYRYTPVTVNVGYEYGSVETFEYARATVNWNDRNTDNGVPIPMIDVRRP